MVPREFNGLPSFFLYSRFLSHLLTLPFLVRFRQLPLSYRVPYSALAKAFSAIEDTTKRILIMQILTKTLIKVMEKSPHELTRVIYLCVNKVSQTESATNRIVSSVKPLLTLASLPFSLLSQIAPDYAGIELGIGETLLIKAIAQASGRSAANVKKDFNVAGDLGKVALVSF